MGQNNRDEASFLHNFGTWITPQMKAMLRQRVRDGVVAIEDALKIRHLDAVTAAQVSIYVTRSLEELSRVAHACKSDLRASRFKWSGWPPPAEKLNFHLVGLIQASQRLESDCWMNKIDRPMPQSWKEIVGVHNQIDTNTSSPTLQEIARLLIEKNSLTISFVEDLQAQLHRANQILGIAADPNAMETVLAQSVELALSTLWTAEVIHGLVLQPNA